MIKKNKIMIIVLVLVMGIGLIYYHNQKKVLTIGIFAGSNWDVPTFDYYEMIDKIIDKNIDANVFIEDGLSQVGGGSMPLETIKTKVVAITPKNMSVSSLEKKLRLSNSHIIARIYDNKYILDVRTIFEEEFEIIANELKKVLN